MGIWQWLLALAMIFTCMLLVAVILLQRGRGGGLAGAFGGAGGMSAFGAKTGDVFTWITVVVAGVFVLLSITGTFVFDMSPRAKQEAAVVAATNEEDKTKPEVTVTPITVDAQGEPVKIERIDDPRLIPSAQPGEGEKPKSEGVEPAPAPPPSGTEGEKKPEGEPGSSAAPPAGEKPPADATGSTEPKDKGNPNP